MSEEKEYTLKELKKKLTEKEKNFCHEYVVDWNGSRAAREAGYSEKTCAVIAHENLTKPHIKQYIDFIKNDYEMLCGISKTKQINELIKIAYSSITRKEFEDLTEDQKACIESIESKVIVSQGGSNIEQVKIKLYSKIHAIDSINKMMGYNEAEKLSHDITKLNGITFDE